ncbi:hypothetical protein [Tessaracoccus sp. OH4464_COT-324]|uniref:hypothetical protein n=1 Tax=Tessaracoccus sp. OH4464_COT-324 TaxID=2491059 RepID=UPI000F64511E|nr:hypothetical protein [Tessaracoccus sp. OH4464_COT-324]RRD47883.1 hypothetical protein EII42_01150 [Tessaracoccus sp. OH4464_COT-324]
MSRSVVTAATLRARQMMLGGLIAGHVVGAIVSLGAYLFGGADGLLTALLGFASVVVFYSVGQWLEVIATELEPMQGLGLVLVSYAVRVVGIAAALWALLSLEQVAPHVVDGWLVASVVATVLAWVTGVVVVASRQRVPIYDVEYQARGEGE